MKYVKGDLLSATKGLIVHGVNCQGVMGSGVALAIKNKYPKVYTDYLAFVEMYGKGKELLGTLQFTPVGVGLTVVNAFTQNNYGREPKRYVSYEAIDQVFAILGENTPIETPIHMPKIGSGLGGGDWGIIESRLEARLHNHDVTVYEL